MLSKTDVERILEESGALLNGHFLLTGGRHSGKYLQCAKILQFPRYSEMLAKELAGKLGEAGAEIVVGPAMGGIIIAYELARQLGAISAFAERAEGKMCLRRGFDTLVTGKRVIVAEDVVTTGGSVFEVMEAVKHSGGIVAGVAALADRSGGSVDFGVLFAAAYTTAFETFDANNCPLCKKSGTPPVKPGSRQ